MMPPTRAGATLLLAMLAAVLLAACGGDGDEREPTSPQLTSLGVEARTEDEVAYLDGVRAAFDQFHGRQAAFRETLKQRHTTTASFFEALEEADVAAAFAPVLERVRALDPPAPYAADHARLLTYLEDAVRLDRILADAVAARDVVAFMVTNPRVGEAGIMIYVNLSAGLCNVVARGDERGFCQREDLPGGEYGSALAELVAATAAEVLPRTAGPIGLLTPSAQFQALKVLQADLIEVLERAESAVRALEPPGDLRADHQRLLRFFEELGDVVHAIYGATETQDFRRYFDESEELADVICRAADDFSPAFDPLVRALFESPLPEAAGAGSCA